VSATRSLTLTSLIFNSSQEYTHVSFSCAKRCGGAVLSLPVDARRQDTLARGAFGKWITQHIDSWFTFAQSLGLGIKRMDEIILVTGCHRTRSWANVTFLEGQTHAQASFGVKVNGVDINWQFSLGNAHGAVCNWGPEGNVCVSLQEILIPRTLKPTTSEPAGGPMRIYPRVPCCPRPWYIPEAA